MMPLIDPRSLVRSVVGMVPEVREHLSPEALRLLEARKDASDLTAINAAYHDDITQALIDYLEGGNIVSARNAFKRATVEAFDDAFSLGWADGGGGDDRTPDAQSWLVARMDEELGHVETLFQQAKELKNEEGFDAFGWASARADGYTNTLQSVYGAGKMWAAKYKQLTWIYGETEHCETCQGLHTQRHQARWYLARDYIPRKPGAAMECGGYQCQCGLYDDDGNSYTIE